MKIAFVYAKGRLRRFEKVKIGHAASEFFYGAIQLGQRGHQVDIIEVHGTDKRSLVRGIGDRLFRLQLLPNRTTGALLEEIKSDICPQLVGADVVVAANTPIAFALGTLKIFGYVKAPIVAIHLGIASYHQTWLRRKVNALVLKRMWTQLFGDGEYGQVMENFNVPKERIVVNQFGVDTEYWCPDHEPEGDYVLSVGNDMRRDYELLREVAKKIGWKVVVVSARVLDGGWPDNVSLIPGTWLSEAPIDEMIREYYRGAQCVVLPLIDSVQPSGQSVCLQAMACGKPVILTRTRGLWSESMMRDGENVIFVPPGDVEALARAIERLMGDPGECRRIGERARETACTEGNIEGFAGRLEALCHRALASQ